MSPKIRSFNLSAFMAPSLDLQQRLDASLATAYFHPRGRVKWLQLPSVPFVGEGAAEFWCPRTAQACYPRRSPMSRPLILLSNDDGYSAQGIRMLAAALGRFARVVVCAPATEQSATSHSISLNRPLRLTSPEPDVFVVDGTPADCVYVALHAGDRVVPRKPDLVVAGLNHGLNLGNDVFYSGTVAAAREGALRGVHSMAFSATRGTDMNAACELSAKLAEALLAEVAPDSTPPLLLNTNFPAGDAWELKATRLGNRVYQDGVDFRSDPRGGEYLWIGTGGVHHTGDDECDTAVFDAGQVGVTPLSLELFAPAHQPATAAIIDRAFR
jgi:5'-nucleotidase